MFTTLSPEVAFFAFVGINFGTWNSTKYIHDILRFMHFFLLFDQFKQAMYLVFSFKAFFGMSGIVIHLSSGTAHLIEFFSKVV